MYCDAFSPISFQHKYPYNADDAMVAAVKARVTGGTDWMSIRGDGTAIL